MNPMQTSLAMIVVLLLSGLTGCARSEPKPPPKIEDTVFAETVKAKERAVTETQKAMDANQQKLDEAMKKNEVTPP